jgi:fructose-1,6-bisphosphatase/inositol monophosphatase family enzyme
MTFSVLDLDTLTRVLEDAARIEIMPLFRKLSDDAIRQKSSATDLVTTADEAAERRIMADLLNAFPGAVVIGEEASSKDPTAQEQLRSARLAFTVDPIDGTLNFVSGLPVFGTMAAVVMRGEIIASVIHDPISGENAVAVRGKGAWIKAADGVQRALHVTDPVPVSRMTGMASWRYFSEPLRSHIAAQLPRTEDASSLRCCAHEYRLAAAGWCHYLLYGQLMPWDHAPGTLLFQEAGGYCALLDGSPYRPGYPAEGLLCAPNEESWTMLRDVLIGS